MREINDPARRDRPDRFFGSCVNSGGVAMPANVSNHTGYLSLRLSMVVAFVDHCTL